MSEFRMGFETELGSIHGRNTLATKLYHDLGLVTKVHDGGPRSYETWFLMNDRSVHFNDASDGSEIYAHELVSPIMSHPQAMAIMKQLFDWMKQNRCYVNTTCGFHVGLSFKDEALQKRVNPLKLLYHFDEEKIVKEWHREGNRYCEQAKPYLVKYIMDSYFPFHEKSAALDSVPKINGHLPRALGKYRTINFKKLPRYVEFRVMGGNRYTAKYDKISETVDHFIECLEKSIDGKPDPEFDLFISELHEKGNEVQQEMLAKFKQKGLIGT